MKGKRQKKTTDRSTDRHELVSLFRLPPSSVRLFSIPEFARRRRQ
jgi:hypothetical protein